MRQAFVGTCDRIIYWRMYASLGIDRLNIHNKWFDFFHITLDLLKYSGFDHICILFIYWDARNSLEHFFFFRL